MTDATIKLDDLDNSGDLPLEKSGDERIHEIDQAVDDMLAVIAHELATPIATARGFAQILHRDLGDHVDDEHAYAFSAIDRNLLQAGLVLQQLRDVRTAERDELRLEVEPVELVELASEVVRDLEAPVLGQHPTQVDAPDGPVVADVDPIRMRQVLYNLLSNAAKYSDSGAPIMLCVFDGGSDAVIEVRNHGFGIAPEDAEIVFRKYTRLEQGAERVRGAGLGLYLARTIVRAHGGDLTTEPVEDGEGSRLVLRVHKSIDPGVW